MKMRLSQKTNDNSDIVFKKKFGLIIHNRAEMFTALLFLILLILSAVVLSSCATKYYPQPSDRISVVDDYAIFQSDGVSFAVSAKQWIREPQKINDYFTTYHIIAINQRSEKITIDPSDIRLLDENRNQYDALTYIDVAEVVLRDDLVMSKFPLPTSHHHSTEDRTLGRALLMQDSFHYGDIMPNARKTGYIFFNRLPGRNTKATIVFKGIEVDFLRK